MEEKLVKFRKLKLISDGSYSTTKVIDMESGQMIEGVRSAELAIRPNTTPVLKLEIVIFDAEVEAEGLGHVISFSEAKNRLRGPEK